MLANTGHYYRQHLPAVQQALKAGMAPLEKQLEVRSRHACRNTPVRCNALPGRRSVILDVIRYPLQILSTTRASWCQTYCSACKPSAIVMRRVSIHKTSCAAVQELPLGADEPHCWLQDLAKLGSWDRLEYYWTRAATESTQRKLHKLTRHAQDVLKQPVATILAGAANAMGFADLKALPDAAVSISDAVSDARDVLSAADTVKKKRRAFGLRPAKGAVAKLLKKQEAVQQTGGEPAEAAAQRVAADAALAAEAAAQREALRVLVVSLLLA